MGSYPSKYIPEMGQSWVCKELIHRLLPLLAAEHYFIQHTQQLLKATRV